MRMYILGIKYRIFATLIWTKACSFITSLCIFPFITPFITPSRNTCAHFIQSALDLFLDAYLQFELWNYDLNITLNTLFCHWHTMIKQENVFHMKTKTLSIQIYGKTLIHVNICITSKSTLHQYQPSGLRTLSWSWLGLILSKIIPILPRIILYFCYSRHQSSSLDAYCTLMTM